MIQTTLLGKKNTKYFCIHCSWKGYNPKINMQFEVCPKCEWVCYSETEIDESLLGLYPVLKTKIKL